jgi:beta-xylosidase
MHRLATDNADAGAQALTAGIDVELPHTLGFGPELLDTVGADVIDRAALRVLTQKADLGLLDPGWMPAEPEGEVIDLDPPGNRRLAGTIAERSIVLLSNDKSVLPLERAPQRIAVIGPAAHDSGCMFGCYSFPNHVVPNHPGLDIGIDAPTVLESIKAEFPGSKVEFELGVPVLGGGAEGIAAAVRAAERADLAVLVVGDRSGMFGHGTSGEGCDALDLQLPGKQAELVSAILEAASKVVLVVVSGRPYAVGRFAARAVATIQAFFPGEEGGQAVAGVLSGRVNPSGRLPVQIPGDASAQPGTYLAPPLALKSDGVSNLDPTPAFPFGHGLSYTRFHVRDASTSETEIPTDGTVSVETTVQNVGDRAGAHVVQLYLSDPVATVTRPVRQLIGFARVHLEPGARAEILFDVHADLASFTGRDLRRRVEPGEIVLTIADSAGHPGTALSVELFGPVRHVDHTRHMSATATVLPG